MKAHGPTVDVDLEVPFYDVDSFQIVWHGNYYKYAEIGRTALLRSRGLDMVELKRTGHGTVVIETSCRHSYPLRYGDRFRVRSWFEDVEHRVNIGFEILNLTSDRRAAHGHAILASTDAEGRLLLVTPEALVQRLR
ncbi:MAG: acyl-CoA thioesterase [Myxococcales bacterium]